MAKPRSAPAPPIVVIYGEDEDLKLQVLHQTLDELLPPPADRGLALLELDGTRREEEGGPSYARVSDDLYTLPFLTERRVVVVRDADGFVRGSRERLEKYLEKPSPVGTLVLVCRSFPRNLKLARVIPQAGGRLHECPLLRGPAVIGFLMEEARIRGKRLDQAAARRIADLIGPLRGALACEVEKLSLYVGGRPAITEQDVIELVGLSREEKIFAAMDAAGMGRLPQALRLWRQVLGTAGRAVEYMATGGIAFTLRKWRKAHRLLAQGHPPAVIAPQVQMWGRSQELETILNHLPPARVERLMIDLADLDAQAKTGAKSIENGVEALLARTAEGC
jgi:DNA polymerase-3 subunit delta